MTSRTISMPYPRIPMQNLSKRTNRLPNSTKIYRNNPRTEMLSSRKDKGTQRINLTVRME